MNNPLAYFFLANLDGKCGYKHYGADLVVADEGNTIAQKQGNAEDCKLYCNSVSGCKSFAVCGSDGTCYLKDKLLTGSETTRKVETCNTYYYACGRKYIIVYH